MKQLTTLRKKILEDLLDIKKPSKKESDITIRFLAYHLKQDYDVHKHVAQYNKCYDVLTCEDFYPEYEK